MNTETTYQQQRSLDNAVVAVVGGAGFLGSHLVQHLINDRHCKVIVIDNLEVGRREWVPKEAMFIHHDIASGSRTVLYEVFAGMVDSGKPSYVFNYAARPYIPDCYDRPIRTYEVNTLGAMQVLNAAHEARVTGILQVSSAEVYGRVGNAIRSVQPSHRSNDGKITEKDVPEPCSTYGVAKLAIDQYIQVRWREAQLPCIALRQFNCVGERETHPYVIPEIIRQLHTQFEAVPFEECPTCKAKPGTPVLCRECLIRRKQCGNKCDTTPTIRLGNNSERDFLYAGDAVRMAVQLMEYGEWGGVYNLGSEYSISIYDLARVIAEEMGYNEVKIEVDETRVRAWEIWHLKSDNTKLYRTMPLRHTIPLREAIRRTLRDFMENDHCWVWE